jgi:hypothetical protein
MKLSEESQFSALSLPARAGMEGGESWHEYQQKSCVLDLRVPAAGF